MSHEEHEIEYTNISASNYKTDLFIFFIMALRSVLGNRKAFGGTKRKTLLTLPRKYSLCRLPGPLEAQFLARQ